MRRSRGLSARLVVAIGLLVTLHVVVFAVLLVTLHDLSVADGDARTNARVGMAANDTRVVLAQHDVEGMRIQSRSLERTGEAADLPHVATLAAAVRTYASRHATHTTPHAETPAARALDRELTSLVMHQRATRDAQRDRVRELTRIAWMAGALGVAATLLCALGFLAYLRRALLAPLRGVVGAAQQLAAGDLRARVGRRDGVGEVGELARTFDQMADSLEESRAALERQNRELAKQRAELIEAVRSAREGASIVRAVLDTTPDAIALLDGAGAVIVDNPPMRSVRAAFGTHASELGEHGAQIPLDDPTADAERRDEIVLPGSHRTFARYAAPVHDGRGRQIGRLLVLREITGEREAERAKQDFFALVSHELRTPLTAILGYVELVLSDDAALFPPEHTRHLEVIDRNARRLVRLVGDLLFAAQVEGGTLLLEPGTIDLVQLVRDAVELARPRAEESAIVLEIRLDPVPPCIGDRDRLAQVLDNLISNALKFTPPGGRVVVQLAAETDRAQLEVSDTGVGIPADDLPRLFERFYRARNATGRAVPGMGLGLTIVRAIVKGHGGTIAVRSDVGHGTTFTVLLPLRTPSQAARGTVQAVGLAEPAGPSPAGGR